jgi:hypothetical protein
MLSGRTAVSGVPRIMRGRRMKNFLPQGLAVWERRAEVEEAQREADAWVDAQRRRERDEREHQRLAEMRASLSDEALATVRHRAEETLATDGVERMRLGYEVLVKLKIDDLLEQACVQRPAGADGTPPSMAVTARR